MGIPNITMKIVINSAERRSNKTNNNKKRNRLEKQKIKNLIANKKAKNEISVVDEVEGVIKTTKIRAQTPTKRNMQRKNDYQIDVYIIPLFNNMFTINFMFITQKQIIENLQSVCSTIHLFRHINTLYFSSKCLLIGLLSQINQIIIVL